MYTIRSNKLKWSKKEKLTFDKKNSIGEPLKQFGGAADNGE